MRSFLQTILLYLVVGFLSFFNFLYSVRENPKKYLGKIFQFVLFLGVLAGTSLLLGIFFYGFSFLSYVFDGGTMSDMPAITRAFFSNLWVCIPVIALTLLSLVFRKRSKESLGMFFPALR